MDTSELLFYDVECFKFDSLAVFRTVDDNFRPNGDPICFWNNPCRSKEEQTNPMSEIVDLVKDKVIVGYNNYDYDDMMLTAFTSSLQKYVHEKSNSIIKHHGRPVMPIASKGSLDTFQQIDVSRPSLKLLEGNLGLSIMESSVDFTIDRPLTPEERDEILRYCIHDVDATIEVFRRRVGDYFATKPLLLQMLKDKLGKEYKDSMSRWNTTTIVGTLLTDKATHRWKGLGSPHGQSLPRWRDVWRQNTDIPFSVWDLWEKADVEDTPKNSSVKVYTFDCNFVFGFGGLHGVHATKKRFKNVKLLDVASMYPSIIILLEALNDFTQKYADIKDERIRIKSTDKLKSNALKLILNSTYGLFKSETSKLYNPKASSTVCIYGQIVIFDLCSRLYNAGYTLVNINTDGVAFTDERGLGGNKYEQIWKEWQADYGLTLELDAFDYWIQKDVNNYLALSGEKVKTKGSELGKATTEKIYSNNNTRIVNIALAEIVKQSLIGTYTGNSERISAREILNEHLKEDTFDPSLWMYVLKAGGTYAGVVDVEHDEAVMNKVNRVYARKARYDTERSVCLVKKRHDGGIVKFPDAPERMVLWNEDVRELDVYQFRAFADIEHYVQVIEKKAREWV